MATHPLGKGTVNIGVNVPQDLKAFLEELARKSNKPSLSAYVREVLEEAAANEVTYQSVKVVSKKSPAAEQLQGPVAPSFLRAG